MNQKKVKKIYSILYIINFLLIIGFFLLTSITSFIKSNVSERWLGLIFYEYLTALCLAPTLCISFLGLNTWGLFIDKPNKKKLIITTIILSIWICWGIYTWSKGVVLP